MKEECKVFGDQEEHLEEMEDQETSYDLSQEEDLENEDNSQLVQDLQELNTMHPPDLNFLGNFDYLFCFPCQISMSEKKRRISAGK